MNPHHRIRTLPLISRPSIPRPALYAGSVALLVLVPLLALATGERFRAMLDFTGGVLTLLSLTAAVVWGLIATDRLLLEPHHRLLAQGVHRAVGVASLGFLMMHIVLKVAAGHTTMTGALVPFGLGMQGSAGLIGLGSLAGYLMVTAGATGALRSAFAAPGQAAGRWRALHALAYPAWCAALLHGLNAGRPAAGYVVALYSLCLLAVGLAVAVRLLPRPHRRRIARLLLSMMRPGEELARPAAAPGPARDPSVAPLPGAGERPGGPAPARPAGLGDALPPLDSTRAVPIASGLGAGPRVGGPGPGAGISAGYRAMSSPGRPGAVPGAAPGAEHAFAVRTGAAGGRGFPDAATEPMPRTLPDPFAAPIPAGSGAGPLGDTLADPFTAPLDGFPGDSPGGSPGGPARDPLTEPFARPDARPGARWPSPSPPPPAEHVRPAADDPPPEPPHPPRPPRPPGPSYPPPPGEPWHEPAGDRP